MQKFKFLVLFLIIFGQSFAQNTFDSEKIFIHTDRDNYAAGDTIWYKVYLFDAATHQFSQKSKVVYVLFQNPLNKIIQESKIAVIDGKANAQIILAKNTNAGNYKFTAYSSLMRNYGENAFYSKTIKVSSVIPALASPIAKKQIAKPEVLFFPEGGSLIDGISSKVAVKLNNFANLPKTFEGKIEDSTGKLITTFYPDFQRIGNFILKPEGGMKYFAVFKNGLVNYKEPLPDTKQLGYVISAENVVFSGGVLINVFTNVNEPAKLKLVAKQRGDVLLTLPFESTSSNFKFVLKNELIPNDGIVEISIIDESGFNLSNRLVYYLKPNPASFVVKNYKKNLLKKGKVSFDLFLEDSEGNSYPNFDFSLAINDVTPPNTFSTKIQDLQSYLVFDADFEENIQKLDSLFSFEPTVSKFYLDNLMMTLDWKKEKTKEDFIAEKSLSMIAKVSIADSVLKNEIVDLFTWDKINMKYSSVSTDAEGYLKINGQWTDSVKVLARNRNGQFLNLKFDEIYNPNPEVSISKAPINANASAAKTPVKAVPTKQNVLKEVVITGAKVKDYKNDYRRKAYNWEPDAGRAIVIDSNFTGSSIQDLIGFTLPELQNQTNKIWIMIDGVSVPMDFLKLLKPADVVWLDLVKSTEKTAKMGLKDFEVINVLTAKGKDLANIFNDNNAQNYIGYTYSKKIYNPIYLKPIAKVDRRKTLLWNPNLKTDKNGKANVSFYNADLTKKYLITIYGTDGKGNMLSQRMLLK
ncbi:hypothetical protein EGI22_19345 [Lacihabitans sp. LS3-19]|uniref:hypothetical protein n=1 Tax=Lacihabitans sp. LS3-19 TaxID=2487335 RepID=UPI0020CE058C|nr:hypothetical protein [Lacihabitans sp. LS3-19]MCP9770064.1 hypothetical protein [Lacihabitans sp. LS3-19]